MYLSNKQRHALEMALEAMDYRNSGEKDDEQKVAYDTIAEMLKADLRRRLNKN